MSSEAEKVEPAESEQDEEEDVYEVERIIDMRVEEGEVLYRVRWKNYCSDDDTWEPEAHLEDCREVLLSFKKTLAEAKAKKEADAKKPLKFLPTKSDVFDADSESDSDKDCLTEAPIKKKKKKKLQEEELPVKEKKKKKKDKRREDFRPLPAPETDEENDVAEEAAASPHPPKEKTEMKKRVVDTDEEEDESVPSKKVRKDKEKEGPRQKKEKGEEGKKKKGKKERKVETSEDEAAAPLEEDLSDGPSQTDAAASANTAEKIPLEEKFKLKKGRLEVRLQGIKDIIADKKSKKLDAPTKDSPKLKNLASKNKEDTAPHSDSSDSSTLHRKSKSKGQEGASATPKAPSSSTSSSSSSSLVAAGSTKGKDDEVAKEEVLGPKDVTGSVNLFEKFLLNCEAKDRAPRRLPPHQPLPEKSCSKTNKLIGKIEKIQKSSKDSPPQKPEIKKMEKKQSDGARPGQSHGFNLDSDEIEGEDSRERKEKPEEAQRSSWERRTSTEDKRRRREDSEPRLFMACDDNQDAQDPSEATDKCDKSQATLSLGMDLNLDWMTLDDFQKHLNGEDEILSGPPLSPSELRDAVKSGDYMAVKLALNSKEEYNLDQEACTIGDMKSFEAEGNLSEERSTSDALRLSPPFDSAQNEDGTSTITNVTPQMLDFEREKYPCSSDKADIDQVTIVEHENVQQCGKNICNSKNAAPVIMRGVEESEDQVQTEGTKMSHEKAGGSSSEISWIFDHINPTTCADGMTTDKDRTVTNGGALKQPSCEGESESADAAEKKSVDQFGNADEIVLKSENEEITTTILQSQVRTVDMEQPTRSSLRTRKKVFFNEPGLDTDDIEIKEPGKKHFCLYCKGAFAQIEKHLEKRHAEETDVVHAIHFPKGSKVRQSMLDQIRDKGDYEHNSQVVRSGEREIAVKKQVKNPNISVRDFLPCKHCFAFYRKTELWRHEQACKVRKVDQKSPERTEKSCNNQTVSQLYPMSEFLTKGCEEIIGIMHQDDISKHIRSDPLICRFGNVLSAKYENDKSQFAYIAQKMRELGRFVLAINELDSSVKYLHEVCVPSRFELAVEGAKKVSGFDPSSSKFKTASLVTKVGYSLKRAAEIAFGESRMTEDSETESDIKTFIHLLDTKWSQCFSRKYLALSMKQDVKKVEIDKSTVTEDLIKLHRFITEEEDEARRDLNERPSLSTWKKLSEATLADVCLFNRGRVGNIGRMLLQTYLHKKRKGIFLPSADQIRKSTKLELHLGASFTRLELEGQFGRNMLVLLTERIVLSVDSLVQNRQQAGVSNTNPYLFARTEGPSFIRGLDCFRRAAIECGVRNPEALLSASLREQIACCWQLMSLGQRELDQVAELLGKSSQDCYTLSHNPLQLEEVSKRLLKMDRTVPTSLTSTTKDGNAQKSALKRKPWSEKEQSAVKRYLCEFITKMKVPGKKECNACIAAEPDLNGRSWTDIKNYVHNTLQTMRRRTNQQKSGGHASQNPRPRVRTKKKDSTEATTLCNMTTVQPDHLAESSDCCMTIAPPAVLRESSEPFHQEMNSSYASLCSTSANMVHTGQPLVSTFTALNATDTQVVPTFTPHNTTNALLPSAYSSESSILMPMSPPYTQHTTSLPAPSGFAQHDTSSSVYSNFSSFNAPSTSLVHTFTALNTPSSSMVPAFSTPNNRNIPIVSSFTPLNHPSTPAYDTTTSAPTTAQVVPTINRPSVPDRTAVEQNTPMSPEATPPASKPQKRIKRLWSEEEQAAVRRQFGDFSKLMKVPGKKDCDACLVAEPALNSRTWREVKYFVHNSIQSIKRKGQQVLPKPVGEHEPETQNQNPEWDGPVYLSL